MEIKENIHLDALNIIFDENNQNYILDKKCIYDSNFLKVVATEKQEALGYAVLYFGDDFLEKEGFPIKLDIKGKVIYIWNCVTKKGYENMGVQSKIFTYFINKFNDYEIYSVVDVLNDPSRRLHDKMGFVDVVEFNKIHIGRLCRFKLMKCSRNKV